MPARLKTLLRRKAVEEENYPAPAIKPKSIEQLSLNGLPAWMKEQGTEILCQHELEKSMQDYLIQLREVGIELNQQVDRWLRGMDFSKLRYTTVGEVNTFFSEVQTLAKLLTTKKPLTSENIPRYNLAVKERVKRLQQKLGRSAFGEELAEFIHSSPGLGENSNSVAFSENPVAESFSPSPLWRELEGLNHLREQFEQKLSSPAWQKLQLLHRFSAHLQESQQNLEQLQNRLHTNQHHLYLTQESLDEKKQELSQLKDEEGYAELEEKEEALKLISPSFEQAKQKVLLFFSPLLPALQQYQKLYPDDLAAEDYLGNYLTAFYEDNDLAIIAILRRMRMAWEEGRLSVEENQHTLLSERIEQANSGELRRLHQEFSKLRQQQLEAEQSTNRALSMKYEDLHYRKEHFQQEAEKLRNAITEIQGQIDVLQSSRQKSKEKFEQLVKEQFGREVELRLG